MIVERVSNLDGPVSLNKALRKGFQDIFMDNQPANGCASLSRRSHGPKENRLKCQFHIGIFHEDDPVVPSQFQNGSAEPAGNSFGDMFSHPDTSRSTDQRNTLITNQPLSHGCPGTGNQVDNPFRHFVLFQDLFLFPHLTVRQNITYGLRNLKDRAAIRKKEDEIMELLNISRFQDRYPGRLSGGEKQKVALGRALATDPELLLLDEVLAGLNTQEIGEAISLIQRLRDERNITILWIEHVMGAIMKVAEKILVLDQGRKLMEGSPEEVVNDPKVIQAYLGE